MPRQVWIDYPGAVHHVMSRGNRRQNIFLDDVDRQDFLKTLAQVCQQTAWHVHAFRLMSNHYHLQQDTAESRLQFERRMEARRLEPGDQESLKTLRRGCCLGSPEFKQRQLEELDGRVGAHHFGELRSPRFMT